MQSVQSKFESLRTVRKLKSKMTYSGPSVEVDVDENAFHPRLVNRHGVLHGCSAMAFDSVHCLLAMGTRYGDMKVSGIDGAEVLVPGHHQAPITTLAFVTNEHLLLSLDSDNTVRTWSLLTKQGAGKAVATEKTSCMAVPFNSKVAYMGTHSGRTLIFDYASAKFTQESIPSAGSAVHAVACIAFAGDDSVLIGYDSGTIALWDTKKRTFTAQFSAKSPVTALSWHTSGQQFISGHENGSVRVWAARSPDASIMDVNVTMEQSRRSPITGLAWSRAGGPARAKDAASIMVAGGLCSYEPAGVVILHGENYKERILIPFDGECDEFIVAYDNPYVDVQSDPLGIIARSGNSITVHDVLFKKGQLQPIAPAPRLGYPTATAISDPMFCTLELFNFLSTLSEQGAGMAPTLEVNDVIDGGECSVAPVDFARCTILATGHDDGVVRIWENGPSFLRCVTTIHLHAHITNTGRYSPVSAVRLFMYDGICFLTVGLRSGHLLLFRVGPDSLRLMVNNEAAKGGIEVISVLAERYIVAGDRLASILVLDLQSGAVRHLKLCDERVAVTCFDTFNVEDPQTGATTHCLYCGLESGTVVVVDLKKIAVLSSFIAKKPSRCLLIAAFDPMWNWVSDNAVVQYKTRYTFAKGPWASDEGPCPLVVVSEHHIRVYSLPDNVYLSKETPEGTLRTAIVKELGGALFIVALMETAPEENFVIAFSLPTFRIIMRFPVTFPVKNARHALMFAKDDEIVVLTGGAELVRISLFDNQVSVASRSARILLADPDRKAPPKLVKSVGSTFKKMFRKTGGGGPATYRDKDEGHSEEKLREKAEKKAEKEAKKTRKHEGSESTSMAGSETVASEGGSSASAPTKEKKKGFKKTATSISKALNFKK